jgi:hypothetical protein
VTGYLHIDIEAKQPVGIEKDDDDEDTERLKQLQGIPEDIRRLVVQSPLHEGTDAVIDGKPEAEHQVGSFPDTGYFF